MGAEPGDIRNFDKKSQFLINSHCFADLYTINLKRV